MKHKMSPARAYLLGLWKARRTKQGVGVQGRKELCEAFLTLCLSEKLAKPDKVKFEEAKKPEEQTKCYFYNSAVRAWLDEEIKKREQRLKYKNEFAASYFAGAFDARGGFSSTGIAYFFGDHVDEIVLLRLGFRARKQKGKVAVLSKEFYEWILPYLKLMGKN